LQTANIVLRFTLSIASQIISLSDRNSKKVSEQSSPPQLPSSNAIEPVQGFRADTEHWFEYPVRVQPHHTDYGGVVWHGSYLTWMEAARVEYLRSIGIDYAELVALGCDLPVIEMSIRYHRAVRLGQVAIVKTRMTEIEGVRINWDYKIEAPDTHELYLTGRVTLVGVDREKGKIMRHLPSTFQAALKR
jgi:acyl-CoA thioester hydrolase